MRSPTTLPEALLRACDGVAELEAAALQHLRDGTGEAALVEATTNLAGLPSDLDGGRIAAQLTATIAAMQTSQRTLLAELALLEEGATLAALAERCRCSRRELESLALSLAPTGLLRWNLTGIRLARPVAAALCNLPVLAAELAKAFTDRVARHSRQDAVAPAPLSPSLWKGIASAVERLELTARTRWEALQLLADTADSDAKRQTLAALAADGAADPALQLLRARLLRQAGDLDAALRITDPLTGDDTLGPDADLEQARSLYAAGRLEAAERHLKRSADRLDPLGATSARRTAAAVRLGRDDASGAREQALESLRIARQHGLRVAEARAHGLLSAIEHADDQPEQALEHALRARRVFEREGESSDLASAELSAAQALIGLQRHAEAEPLLERARQRFAALGGSAMAATTTALQALAALDIGDNRRARTLLEEAISAIDERQPRVYGWANGLFAILLLNEGRTAEASSRLETVVRNFTEMNDLHHARLFAAFATLTGRPAPAPARRQSALTRALLQSLTSPPKKGEGVWTRLLRQTRDQVARGRVQRDGSAFAVPGLPAVDLSRRPTLRRLLAALVTAMEADTTRTTDALFEEGWLGERALPDAARARVYVAIAELRKRGLAPHLSRDGDGYRLQGLRVVDTLPAR